ncbi:MAG: ketopantoate reductase family protein [Myxococcota bacterium]
MNSKPRLESALIVGAGAVGQVVAWHLDQGGSDVGFVVKPRHVESTRAGLTLHHQKIVGKTRTHVLEDYDVIADYGEIEPGEWDAVWLCVSSTALRGEWLGDLLERVPDATIVSLQPGLEDREYMLDYIDQDRLVRGMIPFIAYQSPLPGQSLTEGIAYFLPPMFPFPFTGERAPGVAEALDRGGLSSTVTDNVGAESSMASTILIPAVGGLELEGWDLKGFRKSDTLDLTACATEEAQAATSAHHAMKVPFTNRLAARPWLFRFGLSAASPMLPFDLEAYLEFHFEKTSDQTRQMLAEWIELGERYDTETRCLRELLDRLA